MEGRPDVVLSCLGQEASWAAVQQQYDGQLSDRRLSLRFVCASAACVHSAKKGGFSLHSVRVCGWQACEWKACRGRTKLKLRLSDRVCVAVGPIALAACRGYPTEYKNVWISLFAWGLGSTFFNFLIFGAACTYLSSECAAGFCSPRASFAFVGS